MPALMVIALLAGPAYAHDPWEAASAYRVSVETEGPEDQRKTIVLNIVEKATGAQDTIRFFNRTFRVIESFHLPGDHYLVHGELMTRGDILSVVDLSGGKLIDTIWGWHATFTKDRTRAAYEFRVPPHPGPGYVDTISVLVYDFERSPTANSLGGEISDPTRRGFILYPDEFRERQQYFIPAGSEAEQRHMVSDFAWCDDGNSLAFLEYFNRTNFVVVLDVSGGLQRPLVTRGEVSRIPFLQTKYKMTGVPEREKGKALHAKVIRFVDDCQAIELVSMAGSVTDEKSVVLDFDGTVRRVE